MKIFNKKFLLIICLILILVIGNLFGQVRESFIHDRGLLHETVFNNGIIARPWANRGNEDGVVMNPQFEWPGNSATVLDNIEYYGQHNSKGAGMWIVANPENKQGIGNRLYAFCGGVGKGTDPEISVGVWTFPISFNKVDNFPIIRNEEGQGIVNPDYNPKEAEQIITATWATSTGVTVTRVSRQWSYPDYDDFIIYEYTLEFTGNTDMDPNTIEMETVNALNDVLITFLYNFGPSLYGYMRHYQCWKWRPGVHAGDNWTNFDSDYWLMFNQDGNTGKEDEGAHYLAGKPDPTYFTEFAKSGEHGGGLCSPQAVGFAVLYYDTGKLEDIDEHCEAPEKIPAVQVDLTTGKVRQPYEQLQTVGWNKSPSLFEGGNGCPRIDNGPGGNWEPNPHPYDQWWADRRTFNYKNANKAVSRVISFGPYRLVKGDKIKFAIAEVAGYGSEYKTVEGGLQNKKQFNKEKTMSWHTEVRIGGETLTEDYISDYGYPDYVNSDTIRNIQEVTHKAFEAYSGDREHLYSKNLGEYPWRPEENPATGVYGLIVPPPSPVIVVKNTATGEVQITWTDAAEQFCVDYGEELDLTGNVDHYEIYRAYEGIGPWKLLDTKDIGTYEFLDDDETFVVGEAAYYAVVSVDENGNKSSKHSEMVYHEKNIGAAEKLTDVFVCPNPFYIESGFAGTGVEDMIGFYNLPEECTIRIYSFAGQLVQTLHHDQPSYSEMWKQVTRKQQSIASGIYFFVVSTPDGKQASGKFLIIK